MAPMGGKPAVSWRASDTFFAPYEISNASPVAIIQAERMLHAELPRGPLQFLSTTISSCPACCYSRIADLSSFSAGQGDDHCLGSGTAILCEGASDTKYLIIRMGEDT